MNGVMFCTVPLAVLSLHVGRCIGVGEFKSGRGGAREGAGRPKGLTNEILGRPYNDRRQRQYRATDEEHELVKGFIKILRHNKKIAEKFIREN